MLARQVGVRGFIEQRAFADAVDLVQPRHAALCADGLVAHLLVAQDFIDGLLEVLAIGVAVDHHPGAAARSEEHTSELQSLMRISSAVFCLTTKKTASQQ